MTQLRQQTVEYSEHKNYVSRTVALRDLETTLVDQDKIRPHNVKYSNSADRNTPYCKWLDTTPTYRIRKAFAGLKLPDRIVRDEK